MVATNGWDTWTTVMVGQLETILPELLALTLFLKATSVHSVFPFLLKITFLQNQWVFGAQITTMSTAST